MSSGMPEPPPGDTGVIRIDLARGWSFRRAGGKNELPAEVPGCVHTDLLAAGLIPDPFIGTNHLELRWIESESWEYLTEFEAGPALCGKEHIYMFFEGLDTFADVYLNGRLLLKADNMFRRWRADCSEIIVAGKNRLRVVFSPASGPRGKKGRSKLPGGERVHVRKAAYQFGWDWAPRLVTCGIWRPACLLGWSRGRIADVRIIQRAIGDDQALLTAEVRLETDGGQFRVEVSGPGCVSALRELEPGSSKVSIDFRIGDPELWWTNGLGEQNLYDISVRLVSGEEVLDRETARIGLREIELVTLPDEEGSSFFLRLNGVPVFMKGANYVPQDVFPSRVKEHDYRQLIESVREMNMNMLRVWGGGIYERDIFYDLCDENGILVWQDFMFACGMYPFGEEFLENVAAEASGVVRRLRNHCCMALWCGNNESDEGWHNWGWQERFGYSAGDSARIWNGYRKLFHEILPGVVSRQDGGRDYISTSPKYGRGDPRSLSGGDFHNWWVWHDSRPFSNYLENTGRFMSEFGFQSFPPYQTVEYLAGSGRLQLDSEEISSHQKHPAGNELIKKYMKRDYWIPSSPGDFVYVSQLLQARGVRMGIEAQRRAAPFCMGSLFWQLNDCWPGVTFSCMDYFGRWKALAYSAREGFDDILVSPVLRGDSIEVYLISDRLCSLEGELDVRVLDFNGELLFRESAGVNLPPGSGGVYFAAPAEEITGENGRKRTVLDSRFYHRGREAARNQLYFVSPGELILPEPEIEYDIVEAEGGGIIRIGSGNLVKNISLELHGAESFFSDNYFDMMPGENREVRIQTDKDMEYIRKNFRYRSLNR
ncbi:MAG: beta-mannosidase [Candidatus Krumholzibacteriota bacterium]